LFNDKNTHHVEQVGSDELRDIQLQATIQRHSLSLFHSNHVVSIIGSCAWKRISSQTNPVSPDASDSVGTEVCVALQSLRHTDKGNGVAAA